MKSVWILPVILFFFILILSVGVMAATKTVTLKNLPGTTIQTTTVYPDTDTVDINFELFEKKRCSTRSSPSGESLPYSGIIISPGKCPSSCSSDNIESQRRVFGIISGVPGEVANSNFMDGFKFTWAPKKSNLKGDSSQEITKPDFGKTGDGVSDKILSNYLAPGYYCVYGDCAANANVNDGFRAYSYGPLTYRGYATCQEVKLTYNSAVNVNFEGQEMPKTGFYFDRAGLFTFILKDNGGLKNFEFVYPLDKLSCKSDGFTQKVYQDKNTGAYTISLSKTFDPSLTKITSVSTICTPKATSGAVPLDIRVKNSEGALFGPSYTINLGAKPPPPTTTAPPPQCTADSPVPKETCWDNSQIEKIYCANGKWQATSSQCPAIEDKLAPTCRVGSASEQEIRISPETSYPIFIECEDYVSDKFPDKYDIRNEGKLKDIQIFSGETLIKTIALSNTNYYRGVFYCDSSCHGTQEWSTKNIVIKAHDEGRESAAQTVKLRIDDVTPPVCTLTTDKTEIRLDQDDNLKVTVTCTDDGAGFDLFSASDIFFIGNSGKTMTASTASSTGKIVFTLDSRILKNRKFSEGDKITVYSLSNDAAYDRLVEEKRNVARSNEVMFSIRDTTPPTATIVSKSGSTVRGGSQYVVTATVNDNVGVTKAELYVKKSTDANYGNPVQTNTYNSYKSSGARFVFNVPVDQNQITYKWKIAIYDGSNPAVYTSEDTFTAKPPCGVNKVAPTFLNIQPTSTVEVLPGETVNFVATVKNNYPTANKDCGQLDSAILKLDRNYIMEGTTSQSLNSLDQQQVLLNWKVPKAFKDFLEEQIGQAAGGTQATIITGITFPTPTTSSGQQQGQGQGQSQTGGIDWSQAFASGVFSGSSDGSRKGVYPGEEIGWSIHAKDVSGNSNEIKDAGGKYYKIKIKDIEAPVIDSLLQDSAKATSKTGNRLKIVFYDWNVNNPSGKLQIKEGGNAWKDVSAFSYTDLDGVWPLSGGFASQGGKNNIVYNWSNPSLPENTAVKWRYIATDAVGNSTASEEQSFIVANPPEWTKDSSPKDAVAGSIVVLSKYWKDDTEIKEAMLYIDSGSGLVLEANQSFTNFKEGWINFTYRLPVALGLEKIVWAMKVVDVYGNEGVVDPELKVLPDNTVPEITKVLQASENIYKGWGNVLSAHVKDNIQIKSVEFYIKEPAGNWHREAVPITEDLSEADVQYEWKNPTGATGEVSWYAVAKDTSDNEIKSSTQKFSIVTESAPQGIAPPSTNVEPVKNARKIIIPTPNITRVSDKKETGGNFVTDFLAGLSLVVVLFIIIAAYYEYKIKMKKKGEEVNPITALFARVRKK